MHHPIKYTRSRITAQATRLAAIASFAFVSACAETPPTPNTSTFEQKAEKAFNQLEARGFIGVAAIAEKGNAPIIRGFGDNATASGRPDSNTLVDTGSITKTFTAAAAVMLIDQGKLAPDDTLAKYFPKAPADKAGITVHQLLTHSSGLTAAVANDHDQLGRDEFFNRAFASELLFTPGTGYAYSNVGYSFVAAIIENISGKLYEAFLKEDVLGEHNLTSIGYASSFNPARSMLSKDGKTVSEVSWGGDRAYWALIGNGGLTVSAADMIKFRRLFSSDYIVSSSAVDLAQTPHVLEGEGAQSHYGYGMVVEDHPKFGRSYWHNGGNPEFSAVWQEFEEPGLILFAASNSPEFFADFAAMTIIEAYFDTKIFPDDFDFGAPSME